MTNFLRTPVLLFVAFFLLTGICFSNKVSANTQTTETPAALPNFFENFDGVTAPALPVGWTAFVNATVTGATIQTSVLGNPVSEPQHLRFANSSDANPTMIASSPLVTNFSTNWLTLWASMSVATQQAKLIVGYTSDPSNPQMFEPLDTILIVGNVPMQHFFKFDGLIDTQNFHIALKYLPEVNLRTMYIDDVAWVESPVNPIVELTGNGDYSYVDVNASLTRSFTIRNVGVGPLNINQGDITFTGVDADLFSITSDIEYPLSLSTNSSYTLDVTFSPISVGAKTAQMEIVNNNPQSPFIFPLTGYGLGTITSFFENFDAVSTPQIPGGWSSFVIGTAGSVETFSASTPYSAPNHLRMMNGADANATPVLVGPKIKDFDTNWLRFYAKMSSAAHSNMVIIGHMPVRDDFAQFVPIDTVLVQSNVYTQYTVLLSDALNDDDEKYVAFRFAPGVTHRTLFLDDILWEAAPTEPVMVITPNTMDFGKLVFNTTSEAVEFTILNDGAVSFTLSPEDITLSGANASAFVVNNLEETVVLNSMQTVTISASFAPVNLGQKVATLNVKDQQIPLTGLSADPTIVEFPFLENFDGVINPDLPFGWTKIVNNPTHTGALVVTTTLTSPMSAPNHLRMFSNQDVTADVMAITPPIANLSDKRIRFWSKTNLNSNVPPLLVGTMSDPADPATFQVFHIIQGEEGLTNAYAEFVIVFDETIGTNKHIAFKQGPTPATATRSIFIDDLLFEVNPAGPVLVVEPTEWTFPVTQTGTSSYPKTIVMSNDGVGDLVIEPSDITITGADADKFILFNTSETITLAQFESASISVAFAPLAIESSQATLNILNKQIPLSGSSLDATITQVPHLEQFTGVTVPALPFGWTFIAENSSLPAATVETATVATPFSAPNHVRLNSNNDPDAQVLLITPPINGLNTMRVRFYAKCNLSTNIPYLIVGTMSNSGDTATFTPIVTINTLTNSYSEMFTVYLNQIPEGHSHIAFKNVGIASFARFIYMDDILVEAIPTEPVMVLDPEVIAFGTVQVGEASPFMINVLNDGGGILTITNEDLEISGADAQDFILTSLSEDINLGMGESAQITVNFVPLTTGVKAASLSIDGTPVALSGEGIDATITVLPWMEDFSGIANTQLPFGWTRTRGNWGANNGSTAGGTAPELRFNFSPTFVGEAMVKTPPVNTTGIDQLELTFKSFVNNYLAPGVYTLKVVAVAGGNQYLIHQWVDPDNIAADEYSFILTAEDHGVGAEMFYIAWIFEGTSNDINNWTIDDVKLDLVPDTYTVTFNVEDESGAAINNAIITFAGITNQPGDYQFTEILAGTYGYTITADHFQTIVVESYEVTHDAVVVATMSPMTYSVSFVVKDPAGQAITNAVITLGETTNEAGNYLFSGLLHGSYDYMVVADEFISVSGNLNLVQDAVVQVEMDPVTYTVTFIVKDHNDAAINNAVVTFDGVDNNAGDYTFTDIVAGSYNYSVTAEGFIGTSGEVTVSEDITVYIEMDPETFTITFVVEDETGAAIPDAVITLGDVTNMQGNYVFAGVTAGTYDYTVEAPVYHTVSVSGLIVTGDATIEVTMTLITYTVNFQVADEDGQAISDAVITFDGITNTEGVYVFAGILPGTYDYSVVADGFETLVAQAVVNNDLTIDVEMIAIIPTYTLTFTVENVDGDPITDAIVTLDGVAYDAGMYVFEDLTAGTYSYIISRTGFYDVEDQVVISQDTQVVIVMSVDNVSVHEVTLPTLNIYPNPASSFVNIVSDEIITELRIIDMLGRVTYSARVNETRYGYDVSSYKNGVYFIQIVTSNGIVTQRFQISR